MRIAVSLVAIWILMSSIGCQANQITPESFASPLPPPNQGEITQMPTSPMPVDAGIQNLIEKAKADLANRLAVSVDQIVLFEATSVVWPDASLGCPQPGMVYIQVPEDGLFIRLQVGDQIYPYHSGGFREPFLCETIFKDPGKLPQIDFFNLTPRNPNKASTPDNSIPPGEDR